MYIHAVMPQLTIHGVSDELADRLRELARYATWTPDDLGEFERTLNEQRQVDPDLWK